MNKKKIGIILGVVLLIVLFIVSSLIKPSSTDDVLSSDANTIYNNAVKESESVKDNERTPYTEITVDNYLEKYNANEKSLMLLGRETCQYCQIAEPILQKLSKDYNIEIFYLNTDTFTEEDINNFTNSDETFSQGVGTPLLFIVENGKIIDKVDGVVDTAHYIDFLKANGLI